MKEWWRSRPIAHRGLHRGREIPENSLLAFEHAIKAGHPIELDVIVLKDGTPAVFHDEDLQRLTGVLGATRSLTRAHLPLLSIYEGDQHIPTLREVCELVQGRVPLMVEIKCDQATGRDEAAVMQVLRGYQGEFAIQSFNPYVVLWFKKHAPKVTRGLLSYDYRDGESNLPEAKKILLRHLTFVPLVRPHFLSIDHEYLRAPAVRFYRDWMKIPVIAWTVRSQTRRAEIAQLCENIIFEGYVQDVPNADLSRSDSRRLD